MSWEDKYLLCLYSCFLTKLTTKHVFSMLSCFFMLLSKLYIKTLLIPVSASETGGGRVLQSRAGEDAVHRRLKSPLAVQTTHEDFKVLVNDKHNYVYILQFQNIFNYVIPLSLDNDHP